MPASVLTFTPIISAPSLPPPHLHALTWSSHRYKVPNGHLYESKQEMVGHWVDPSPAGRLVLPLIDRYLILDGDSGLLSGAGRRSR